MYLENVFAVRRSSLRLTSTLKMPRPLTANANYHQLASMSYIEAAREY
jgi:hypothetical protein